MTASPLKCFSISLCFYGSCLWNRGCILALCVSSLTLLPLIAQVTDCHSNHQCCILLRWYAKSSCAEEFLRGLKKFAWSQCSDIWLFPWCVSTFSWKLFFFFWWLLLLEKATNCGCFFLIVYAALSGPHLDPGSSVHFKKSLLMYVCCVLCKSSVLLLNQLLALIKMCSQRGNIMCFIAVGTFRWDKAIVSYFSKQVQCYQNT